MKFVYFLRHEVQLYITKMFLLSVVVQQHFNYILST